MTKAGARGQAALEYILVMLAFFSAFALLLPAYSFVVDSFMYATDSVLAKQISQEINSEVELFAFLSNGSEKTFAYTPAKEISFINKGGEVFVSSKEKEFQINIVHEIESKVFSQKFSIKIIKQNNVVQMLFN